LRGAIDVPGNVAAAEDLLWQTRPRQEKPIDSKNARNHAHQDEIVSEAQEIVGNAMRSEPLS
jgi:hypothetical protein